MGASHKQTFMLKLDSTDYECVGEGESVYSAAQIAELTALRASHPEIADWSLERVSMAWACYSTDVYLAGYLAVDTGRNPEFIAYLYGKEHKLIRQESASCSDEVAAIRSRMVSQRLLV